MTLFDNWNESAITIYRFLISFFKATEFLNSFTLPSL